jgi:hypothetical protein
VDPVSKSLEILQQWYQILGPAFVFLAIVMPTTGKFLFDMYTFNVENKVENAFPSQTIIYIYFFWILITATIVTIMAIIQSIQFYKAKRTTTTITANN